MRGATSSPSSATRVPRRKTARGKMASHPSKGLQPHFVCSLSPRTRRTSPGSTTTTSASPPMRRAPLPGRPKRRAGLRQRASSRTPNERDPSFTRRSMRGYVVSTLGAPGGAAGNAAFSSIVWGAWSLASTGMRPETKAAQRVSRSCGVRRGGLILPRAPRSPVASWRRCMGVTSDVRRVPSSAARPRREERWATWRRGWGPVARRRMAATSASSGRARAWSARLLSSRGRRASGSSAWTVTRGPSSPRAASSRAASEGGRPGRPKLSAR